jgi:hypothetical protein
VHAEINVLCSSQFLLLLLITPLPTLLLLLLLQHGSWDLQAD